ncbi:MAG TPA: hypothetical protein VLA58_07170 [Chitinophagaceae bacterium]|nr:hypothetical protein [Chitinophagaceae bacterium]
MRSAKIMFVLTGLLLTVACNKNLHVKYKPVAHGSVSGTGFYKQAAAYNWEQRDSLFLDCFNRGNVPKFFFQFIPITLSYTDSLGNSYKIVFYCSPDYALIGTDQDWARVPLTPMAAQVVADSLHCFLPTRKMVDLIYQQSTVKLEPVPMYAFRDSTVTMWQHHLMIEGQRKGIKGLISGIKKDVVICSEDALKGKANRVAIYGWHKLDGKPIQPLYTGHVNWYADYSHGIRMIYDKIRVNGKWIHFKDVFQDPILRPALTDETGTMMLRY